MEANLINGKHASSAALATEADSATSCSTPSKHELGQYLTPSYVADLMAGFFANLPETIQLLDAGAGEGALTAAFVRRFCTSKDRPKRIEVTAYEVDHNLIEPLQTKLARCQKECHLAGIEFETTIVNDDFIHCVVPILRADLFSQGINNFNAAIVNPPYRKLRSDSSARLLLRSIGIETSNFYSAFVLLIARLLSVKGELVAITPRSFCNGPYFEPFRIELLQTMALRRIHLFDSRSAAFGKDKVLQENVVVHAVKNEQLSDVVLSNSSGRPDGKVTERRVSYSEVVSPTDPEQFIRISINETGVPDDSALSSLGNTLTDLNLSVSTGRVVDFRARHFLRDQAGADTAPLIYPTHFNGNFIAWPKERSRKPNAILISDDTRDLLVPSGFYVLVKRFSSKEEKRRIVACVYNPTLIPAPLIGFENHLNYFHRAGAGFSSDVALGLAAFLNSTAVDMTFRQFSGHTQVNATDLRKLNYPSLSSLEGLGKKISSPMTQTELDTLLVKELFHANQ